ncbi:PREDICTED: uncharacterized protein LOC107353601 [Acropora digitifera]|uniref:uncharacterized protein LOC107353601 n=1 Tax=Acropora digitifera TaxID=70779 RepID=UPI00077A1C4E|nr:PREDICTED: uncharacterized protein LOC107353601 [Acropora digitifera]
MELARRIVPFWLSISFLFIHGVQGAEQGEIEMELIGNETYQCQYASFSASFPNSGTPVRVFVSVNHHSHSDHSHSSHEHDTVLVWVEDISTSRFKTCVVTGGQEFGADYNIHWLAFQGAQSGVQHGQARYGLFTTGTKCTRVVFAPAFSTVPYIQTTVQHGTVNKRKDAMDVWIESLSKTEFEVCLRESRTFDGPHSNLSVNWMAYEQFLPSPWKARMFSKILFSKYEIPSAHENYALCKTINFTAPFYMPPKVLVTAAKFVNNTSSRITVEKGPLSCWAEEIERTFIEVCVKDYAGIDGRRDDLEVNYVAFGGNNI